jgi:tRNA A37 threonylcarbamoyltransferase TsaD
LSKNCGGGTENNTKSIVLAGGVGANSMLRDLFLKKQKNMI